MFSADDDDDFSVSGSSKLASLFNADQSVKREQSLTYNAPKQPRKSKPAAPASQATGSSAQPPVNVLHATAVHTFKYDGTKHVSEGKLGLAIIGNHETPTYKLLLYRGQKQHVAFATINATFTFVVQANNYATFYDDTHQNWSVNFDTVQLLSEFSKQVCLAKVNTLNNGSMKTTIIQDLVMGEGDSIHVGDLLEIKFTGWFLTNKTLGKMFDNNLSSKKPMKFRIGQGKCVKGLEDGVTGMKKHGKRMIVVPPNLGYGNVEKAESALKTNVLVYEVEVLKCKFNKDSVSTHSSTPDLESDRNTESPSRNHSFSVVEDSSIRARCASLSEQLTQSPDKKKATIISRIVKMGQPMLPLQGAVVAQPSSESENEEELTSSTLVTEPIPISGEATTKPIPKPRPQQPSSNITQQSFTCDSQSGALNAVAQPVNVFSSTQVLPHSLPLTANPSFAMLPQSSFSQTVPSSIFVSGGGDGHLSLLLAENRTQNMELRMNMTKLAEKLDSVLSKVDSKSADNSTAFQSMESNTLAHNIQRICQENESLKNELKEKNAKIEAQNEKICNLLQKNQTYMEQNTNLLEQRNNSMQTNTNQFQSKLGSMEDENRKLSDELKEVTDQLSSIKVQLHRSEDEIQRNASETQDANEKYKKLKELIDQLEAQKADWENEKRELNNRILTTENKQLSNVTDNQIEDLRRKYEDEIARIGQQIEQLKTKSATDASPNLGNEVKKIMNAVYKHLQSEFMTDENYTGTYVHEQLKKKIINITLQLTQKYSQKLDDVTDHSVTVAEPSKENNDAKSLEVESSIDEVKQDGNNEQRENEKIIEEKPVVEDVKKIELQSDHVSDTSEDYEPWKPQPPPPPAFVEETDDDDWLK